MDKLENIKDKSDNMITVVGAGVLAAINSKDIVLLVKFSNGSNDFANFIYEKALSENKLMKLTLDKDKIKTLIILNDNRMVPSTFGFSTLKKRCDCLRFINIITGPYEQVCINQNYIYTLFDKTIYKNKEFHKHGYFDNDLYKYFYNNKKTRAYVAIKNLNNPSKISIFPSNFNYRTLLERINA